jgi:hypothetical protein
MEHGASEKCRSQSSEFRVQRSEGPECEDESERMKR